jgi:hypothetical protein
MIFFDGDGKEYHRTMVSTPDTVEAAYKKALEMYAKRPVSWASGDSATAASQADSKKLLALAFLDEKKDSETFVASLEDRWVAKHHDRFVFSRIAFDRNSEECKKWGVTSAPTLLLVNPAEENPKKSIVDQLVSKKELTSVRAFLIRNIEKLDRASKK